MSYQALYRVWRPKQLSDVVGQEHIMKTIKSALIHEKLSHAYLFTGPRGTGKTSAAKLIAKAVNCQNAPVVEPCNECYACRGITDGSIVDVLEIDAASNNGVDEIRDIRDKVKFAPSSGIRYKVYIIDEVHMLSTGAFNALLKTLEEPPKHVIFILATTEPHKIPLTIISRCQRFDFKRITNVEMIKRMEYILSHYDTKVTREALEMIAKISEGGMRDALSLLDQAISYSDGTVSLEDILTITGAVSQKVLLEIGKSLVNGDIVKALRSVDELVALGKDPNRFIEDLIFFYRDMLMYKTVPDLADALERVTPDDEFEELCNETSMDWIYKSIETLNEIIQDMKWSSHPKIFIEVAIVKICNVETEIVKKPTEDYSIIYEKLQSLEKRFDQLGNLSQQPIQSVGEQTKKNKVPFSTKTSSPNINSGQIKGVLREASKQELIRLTSTWPQIMESVKQKSIPAHAWLSDGKPVVASSKQILIAFQNEMHRDMIDTKFRTIVEDAISRALSNSYSLFTLLTSQWNSIKEEFIREQRGEVQQTDNDPIVNEAIKLVGNELIEIIE